MAQVKVLSLSLMELKEALALYVRENGYGEVGAIVITNRNKILLQVPQQEGHVTIRGEEFIRSTDTP